MTVAPVPQLPAVPQVPGKVKGTFGCAYVFKINCCSTTTNEKDNIDVEIETEEVSVEQTTEQKTEKAAKCCCIMM